MIIKNTDFEAQHPWPEGVLVQGGKAGLVLMDDKPNYLTAFVEAFPNTFLRGEGKDLAEAEDNAWAKHQKLTACPTYPTHGPFERRHYRNGAGYCTSCGGWFDKRVTGFDELPDDPDNPRPKSALEVLFQEAAKGDAKKVAEIVLDDTATDEDRMNLVTALEIGDYATFKELMFEKGV